MSEKFVKLESRKFRRDGKCITASGAVLFILMFFSFSAYAQYEGKLLEKAYKKKSTQLLDQFFMNWNKQVQPVTEEELSLMNDTIMIRKLY